MTTAANALTNDLMLRKKAIHLVPGGMSQERVIVRAVDLPLPGS
jgi:hypothetical protein